MSRDLDLVHDRLDDIDRRIQAYEKALGRAVELIAERSTRLAAHMVWNDYAYDFLAILGDTLTEHLEDGHPARLIAYRACRDFNAKVEERMPRSRRDVLAIISEPFDEPRRPMTFIA